MAIAGGLGSLFAFDVRRFPDRPALPTSALPLNGNNLRPPPRAGVLIGRPSDRLRGSTYEGEARGFLGPLTIARVEVSYDGRTEWRPIAPSDGIFDATDESFDADVSTLVPTGTHIIAVRAYDSAGNSAVKEAEAK